MALSIKNSETERLARELATATGKSVTAAVTEALERSLRETANREAEREAIYRRTMAIARESGALWPVDLKTWDYDAWLYDEDGLPR